MAPDKRKDHLRALYDLDVKDLSILAGLLAGGKLRAIAREIFLTPPAVSHRLRRLEGIFECDLLQKKLGAASERSLTLKGLEIATAAKTALDAMIDVREELV